MDKPVTPDRRRFRYAVKPRPFVVMTGSGGILRDVSDEGLAIDVVGPSLTTKRIHFNFAISETGERFEGLGEVIWKNESGSRIGVRFVDLSDRSRHRFQNWLSTKSDSAVSFKNGNRQNCGEARNSATHLWMRPRADASGPSEVLNLPEETRARIRRATNETARMRFDVGRVMERQVAFYREVIQLHAKHRLIRSQSTLKP